MLVCPPPYPFPQLESHGGPTPAVAEFHPVKKGFRLSISAVLLEESDLGVHFAFDQVAGVSRRVT